MLAAEFARELEDYGRIYMHRFRPTYPMHARPIDAYPARCRQTAAIMVMIQNNLDPAVAQFPHELITYGGNGAVFQNWAQYRLTVRYPHGTTYTYDVSPEFRVEIDGRKLRVRELQRGDTLTWTPLSGCL